MSETLSSDETTTTQAGPGASMKARLAVAWTVVGVPLAYGIYQTAKKASALFAG